MYMQFLYGGGGRYKLVSCTVLKIYASIKRNCDKVVCELKSMASFTLAQDRWGLETSPHIIHVIEIYSCL